MCIRDSPYWWSTYYAGRAFEDEALVFPGKEPPVYYVVLDRSRSRHPHLIGQDYAQRMARNGKPVETIRVRRGKYKAEVVIYEVRMPQTPVH